MSRIGDASAIGISDVQVNGKVEVQVPLCVHACAPQVLAAMGYAQELSRGIKGWVMSGAFCFNAIGVVPSIAASISLGAGGSVVAVWSWIVCSVFTMVTSAALAELCSAYPSAGSVYHWTGQLAGPRWAPLLSLVTGWLNLLANAASDVAWSWGAALLVDAIVESEGTGDIAGGKTGVAILFSCVWALVNIISISRVGWLHLGFALWQITAAVVTVIVLFSRASLTGGLNASSTVWLSWHNSTGFDGVDGYVILIGLMSSLFSFSGYEVSAGLFTPSLQSLMHISVYRRQRTWQKKL